MSQVYGCIECGMLFAGWEFCLAHIENCRPQHYLEVDKSSLKQMCMIGHNRCIVPSYQPSSPAAVVLNNNNHNHNRSDDYEEDDSDLEEFDMGHSEDEDDDDDEYEHENKEDAAHLSHFFSQSSSSEEEDEDDDSTCQTTLTEDFLNPVEGTLHHVAMAVVELEQEAQQQQHDEQEQDEMVRDLFHKSSNEEKQSLMLQTTMNNYKTIMAAVPTKNTPTNGTTSTRPPRPISVTPKQQHTGLDDDFISNTRTPKNGATRAAQESKKRLQKMEQFLHGLIQEASPLAADQPKMVLLEMVPKAHEVQCGTKLEYQAMGYVSLKALLRAIPSVTVVKNSPYFGIEHEYIRFAKSSSTRSLMSYDEDDENDEDEVSNDDSNGDGESNDESLDVMDSDERYKPSINNSVEEKDSFSNQRTPQHTNHLQKPFSFNSTQTNSMSSSEERLAFQPMSAQQSASSKKSTPNRPKMFSRSVEEEEEDASISNSTVSSCGSSRSVINALAEMLPNTNAYNNIVRVMSKYPNGINVGQLLQQAPEFKDFLSHCTDRRCEAQIKLAHNVLQQCPGMSHKRTLDGVILYCQSTSSQGGATKRPLSIITKTSLPESKTTSSTVSSSKSESIEERAAKLFASSEFMTPTASLASPTDAGTSRNALSKGPDPPSSPFVFRRPPHLETIATPLQMTPNGSRTSSPLAGRSGLSSPQRGHLWTNPPSTPPRPRMVSPRSPRMLTPRSPRMLSPRSPRMVSPSTPSKELEIAESAARILAHAQSMTTPRLSTSTDLSPLASSPLVSENAMRTIDKYTQEGSSNATSTTNNAKNSLNYRPDARLYFFTDEMAVTPDEESFGSLGRASSSMTADTEHSKHTEDKTLLPETSHANTISQEEKPEKTTEPAKSVVKEESPSENDVAEKIAMDLFPATDMHYKLLVALAEHPHGMTWNEIDICIPQFSSFVAKNATDKGFKALCPTAVLDACVTIRRKEKRGTDLYFIDAPKTMPSDSHGPKTNEDEASVTSGMTESSTLSSSLSLQDQLALELAFEGSDISATVFFLRMLKHNFKSRPWPSTRAQVNRFLARSVGLMCGQAESEKVVFNNWFDRSVSSGTATLSANQKTERAFHVLMNQMQRLNCVNCENFDLNWDGHFIDGVLDHMETIQKPSRIPVCCPKKVPLVYVETLDQLDRAAETDPFCSERARNHVQLPVSVMCVGTPHELHLILIGTESETYIFDCVKLGPQTVCTMLTSFFTDNRILKVFHDLHSSASALANLGGIRQPMKGAFDTQLAMESLMGDHCMGFNDMVRQFGISPRKATSCSFGQRPLSKPLRSYAKDHVYRFNRARQACFTILLKNVQSQQVWKAIQTASDVRAAAAVMKPEGKRQMCFDAAHDNAMASLELLRTQRPADILSNMPLSISNDVSSFLDLLGQNLAQSISDAESKKRLSAISLDKGQPAMAWLGDKRVILGSEQSVVNDVDIDTIVSKLGGFGENYNRVGLENELHCISALRNQKQGIVGLTMRVGRAVTGAAQLISDLLFADPTKSILFLGESGTGKTAVLREAARLLAEHMRVSIVDTNGEIAGCHQLPHSSVGKARRHVVDKVEEQGSVMMQCARDHRPNVMVVDELEMPSDVDAAVICKRRSVRLLASAAVGSLRELMEDPRLSGLVGGTTGASKPIFDVVVELRRGALNEWRIISDTSLAGTAILDGASYPVQVRTRDPTTGSLQMEYEEL